MVPVWVPGAFVLMINTPVYMGHSVYQTQIFGDKASCESAKEWVKNQNNSVHAECMKFYKDD